MRFLFTFGLAFLCLNVSFAQSCFPNGIAFYSQEDIDNFSTNYPNCTEIIGALQIIGDNSPITSVEGLSQLTGVNGIAVAFTDLSNLSGLENINSSINSLDFYGNPSLLNVDALSNIQFLSNDLVISDNALLNDINALGNIELGDSTWLFIDLNPNLSFCSLINVCNHLSK